MYWVVLFQQKAIRKESLWPKRFTIHLLNAPTAHYKNQLEHKKCVIANKVKQSAQ